MLIFAGQIKNNCWVESNFLKYLFYVFWPWHYSWTGKSVYCNIAIFHDFQCKFYAIYMAIWMGTPLVSQINANLIWIILEKSWKLVLWGWVTAFPVILELGGGQKKNPNPQEVLIYQYVTYIYHFQTFFIKKNKKKPTVNSSPLNKYRVQWYQWTNSKMQLSRTQLLSQTLILYKFI